MFNKYTNQLNPGVKNKSAFTLVELIIVITILAILGTIAYISFQGYTKDARDGVRISDIKQIYNGLSIYKTQTEKTLLPDNYINIQSGTTTISYQGYAGASVLRTLKISGGKDPGTKDYYIYTTDVNTKKAQLMTYMETADKDVQYLSKLKNINIINQANALTNTGYYQDKKIYVYGDKIGILTDSNKVPLQETTSSTGINILTTTTPITTYFGGSVYSGGISTSTGLTLINQINGAVNNTLPCSSTTYNGYTITSLQDSQSGSFTKVVNNSPLIQTGSIVATCNNGTLNYSGESIQNGCVSGYTWNGSSCDLNKYTVSGTIVNGSGGTINLCGTSTNIDSNGNFTLNNVVYGANCSGINVIRSLYNCSISTDGPSSLTGDITTIAGNCLDNYTTLLLHFDNNYIDNSPNLSTFSPINGPLVYSSTVKKFGTSLQLNGSSYLNILSPYTNITDFGTGDFTIDFWINFNNTSASVIFDLGGTCFPPGREGLSIAYDGSRLRAVGYTRSTSSPSWDEVSYYFTPTLGEWYHVALVKQSGSAKFYLNGNSGTSSVWNDNITVICTSGYPNLFSNGGSQTFNGYIDEVRISKGIARRTASFTPPTSPY